ncbi:MAG TPA: uroporphyrinogen decarboxylase family protein [Candidatus Acidoferrum sp.]|nr:uroporphyrinogen decarboxylase family protein [Candidatus Acidoferrum sp.]
MTAKFDYTKADAMAMPATPMDPAQFDFARYEAFAADADRRYAEFLRQKEGVAVWQRVRVGEVFRDACRDLKQSLRWQLGGLTRAMDYLTDAPAYLEPWYGIGTTASAFGSDYEWLPGQAPAVKPVYRSMVEVPELTPQAVVDGPILRYTLKTIEYFLEQTKGRLPMSWCDIQSPINVAGGLVDISQFLMALRDEPERTKRILSVLADELIRFTKIQSDLIGPALARPGHGFASSRNGTGIGLSTDNLIMVSPAMYADFCAEHSARIGDAFGGTAIHSCGDWALWLPAVKEIRNLMAVDGAFSPQTDPAYNRCEAFRDALAGTGIILHARVVGDPQEVLSRVKRLWKPGVKLIVGTHVQDPQAQHRLYHGIHRLCT